MNKQRIANLSLLKENETFTNDLDGLEYNLFDFLNGFAYAYYRSGVWNDYKRVDMQTAIEFAKNSGYGADIEIEFDEKWENGEIDGNCNVYFSCPCDSDMW